MVEDLLVGDVIEDVVVDVDVDDVVSWYEVVWDVLTGDVVVEVILDVVVRDNPGCGVVWCGAPGPAAGPPSWSAVPSSPAPASAAPW